MQAAPFLFRLEVSPTHRPELSDRLHPRVPLQDGTGCRDSFARMPSLQTTVAKQIELCVTWRLLYIIAPMKSIILRCTVLLIPVAMLAHHAYSAEFDTTKPVKLSGVL